MFEIPRHPACMSGLSPESFSWAMHFTCRPTRGFDTTLKKRQPQATRTQIRPSASRGPRHGCRHPGDMLEAEACSGCPLPMEVEANCAHESMEPVKACTIYFGSNAALSSRSEIDWAALAQGASEGALTAIQFARLASPSGTSVHEGQVAVLASRYPLQS